MHPNGSGTAASVGRPRAPRGVVPVGLNPQLGPTVYESIREGLRRVIVNGTLPGGTRLIADQVADWFGVSPTPTRDALVALATEGLVVHEPRRGVSVRGVTANELAEVYEIRRALEPLAIRKATGPLSAELVVLQARMDSERDPVEWAGQNWRFYRALVAAAESPRLESMVATVQDLAAIHVARTVKENPHQIAAHDREHRELLDALRCMDTNRAAAVHVEHLDAAIAAIARDAP